MKTQPKSTTNFSHALVLFAVSLLLLVVATIAAAQGQTPQGNYYWNVEVMPGPAPQTTVYYYGPQGQLLGKEVRPGAQLNVARPAVVARLSQQLDRLARAHAASLEATVFANLVVEREGGLRSIVRLYDSQTRQLVYEEVIPGEHLRIESARVRRLIAAFVQNYTAQRLFQAQR
ncbi:MAG: hypothetical protein SFY70_12190 [Bacteroidia bacterium]|nr:hypothetical protein [Bacteroidia bacterium]